jgi:leucine dehydrogenase
MIDERLVGELRCEIVCGSANNQLSDDRIAEELAAGGILYAPDFIANAGGLINVALELTGYDAAVAMRRVMAIEAVMTGILEHAEAAGLTPLAAAHELARLRLAGAGTQPLAAVA